jgi:hypothetical protein
VIKKKSYKYDEEIEINGRLVPRRVFERAISMSVGGKEIGIWDAEDPARGVFNLGFIVSPLEEIELSKDRFLIKGYSGSSKPGKEEIPEPFYVHSSTLIGKGGFSPLERDDSRFEPASIRKIEPANWDVKLSSNKKMLIKKSEWFQIGIKSGWIKDVELTKEANLLNTLGTAAIVAGMVPSIMSMFGGSKEEAAQQISEMQQNPGQFQQFQSQVSQDSQKLDMLIQNLIQYTQKMGLNCAQTKPPSKCPGASVATMRTFKESYNKIESRYNGLSKGQSSENPCAVLKDALDLSSCAKSLLGAMSQMGEMRPSDFFDSDIGINLA